MTTTGDGVYSLFDGSELVDAGTHEPEGVSGARQLYCLAESMPAWHPPAPVARTGGDGICGWSLTRQRPRVEDRGLAHDPILSSFLIVGVFGGLALFLNLTSEWGITSELKRATEGWTAPLVVRGYRDDRLAREKVRREAALLLGHGYEARLQRGGSDDLPLGGAAATGERVVLPGTHNDGMILITYWRA